MKLITLLLTVLCFPIMLIGQKNEVPNNEQFIPKDYNSYLSKFHDINQDGYKDYFIIT